MAADNNSLSRADGRPTAEERRRDLQVFDGVKQVKKKDNGSFWNWLARMFFSGRKPKDIVMDVLEHEVVPNIQDGVYNSVVSFVGKTIYREDRKPGVSAGYSTPGSFITNYVAYGDKKKQAALEASRQKEEETVKSGFESPAFPNLNMAKEFLASMHAYVGKYETMSVQDLAWMQNKSIDYTWDKWGWDRDEILAIREPARFTQPVWVEDKAGNKMKLTHFIDMPKAHEL